ncbi:putative chitinase 3 [Armadillidium vulgare]|nr:putative chitinase 3 [Armadillidium vulgare]
MTLQETNTTDLQPIPPPEPTFITNALAFVNQYGFGGIDLDWEYPVCPQVKLIIVSDAYTGDKDGFSAWVQELAEAFHPEGLLVTAAVSAAYDVPSISTYLDHINVMTYDYHGSWDGQTGHVSPLYAHPDDVDPKFNTDYSIHDWIDKGADPQKVILGIPFYGQSFTLADASNNGLNAQTYGGGEAGTYTRQMGFLAYYEICYDVEQGWTVVQDPLGTMGPYAYSGTQWVSYDDIAMVQTKSEYIVSNSLGGAMIWALDLDDFTNRCGGSETYPLLKTVNRVYL